MIAPVHVCPNVKSWKREMKWMRLLQMRSVEHDACIQMRIQRQVTVHALMYGLFAYNAINKNPNSWVFLLIDVILGLISFLIFHYINGDFSKIL